MTGRLASKTVMVTGGDRHRRGVAARAVAEGAPVVIGRRRKDAGAALAIDGGATAQ